MDAPSVSIGLLGTLLFGLGFHVSTQRMAIGKNNNDDKKQLLEEELQLRIRAHGNTAEYAPYFATLFLFYKNYYANKNMPVALKTVIALAVISRYAIAYGLLHPPKSTKRVHPARYYGAVGTYVLGFGLSSWAIYLGIKDLIKK